MDLDRHQEKAEDCRGTKLRPATEEAAGDGV